VTEVLAHLNVDPDWSERPYESIRELKEFRDSIAHGKPMRLEADEIVEGTADEIDAIPDLSTEWEAYCVPGKVFATYDDVDAIWKQLLDKSKLALFDTLSGGSSQLTFIEKIAEG
jgi:hypothetical protein